MSKSNYINLINVIPKEISDSVEFWIKCSSKHFEKVDVPCGGRMQYKTDLKSGAWHVYAVIDGVKTKTYSTIFPSDTYVCRIKNWSDEIFERKIQESDIDIKLSSYSLDSISQRLAAMVKAKKPAIFEEASEVLLSQYLQQKKNSTHALMEVVKILSKCVFDDVAMQDDLRIRIVNTVLAQTEILSLEQKTFFLLQLRPEAAPREKQAYADWNKQVSKNCESWLSILGQINDQIDPNFDETSLPQFGVGPSGKGSDSKQKIALYNEQYTLRKLQRRLLDGTSRYFSLIPYALNALNEKDGNAVSLCDEDYKALKKVKLELVPEDDFFGRDLEQFGIGEHINISLPKELELSAEQSANLRWVCGEGEGYLFNNGNGNAVYVAGYKQETARVSLINLDGSKDILLEQEIVTVAPVNAVMRQAPDTSLKHIFDTYSVGFLGEIFLLPNVSYNNVLFREGTAEGIGLLWLSSYNGLVHPVGSDMTITNNKVNGTDTVFSGTKVGPYGDGTFDWPIPWEYKIGQNEWVEFTIANHYQTSEESGQALIQKKGAGPFTKDANAPTSDY